MGQEMGVYDWLSKPNTPPDSIEEDDLVCIHEASMYLLEEVGIQVTHPRAREILETHGGAVDEDDIVTVPRELVEQCLDRTPSQFTLHARNPDNDVVVGGDGPIVRTPGYGSTTVLTFEDGRRPSTIEDYETLLKLAQTEDVITCAGYELCQPTDVDRTDRHLEMLVRSLTLTDLPVMGPTGPSPSVEACFDLVGVAMDDPALEKPYVSGLVNTVPPRSTDEHMLEALLTYAEYGQPPIVSSFTMAGASGPATLAGTIAQANAETLLGITLVQLVNPGAPVVYGLPCSPVDTRYGSLAIGNPETGLFATYAARLGRLYEVPSRAGGGLTDAKTVDYQAGSESALVGAITEWSGVDFVLHSVGILESYATISPEKFVLDCDVLRYLDRLHNGVSVDTEHLALDLIGAVDPAEHFLDHPRTESSTESEIHRPVVFDKRSHGEWADRGGISAFELAHERVRNRLANYERPPIDSAIERELNNVLDDHRREIGRPSR